MAHGSSYDDLYEHPEREQSRGPGNGAGSPCRAPVTARLAPATTNYVFRVSDPETAEALGRAFAPRDANNVAADADGAVDRAASSSAGQPLPGSVRERFESSLGVDLSPVRVHTGAASHEAARAVGARAYTVGQDIHFAENQFAHDDPFGMHLLAHEVAHTVQQRGGTPTRQNKLEVTTPGDAAEVEADRAADAMVAGAPASVRGGGGAALARAPEDEEGCDPNPGDDGGHGRGAESNEAEDKCEEDASDRRTKAMNEWFAGQETNWMQGAGSASVTNLETTVSTWDEAMPAAKVKDEYKDHIHTRTYPGAIRGVWTSVQQGWNSVVPVINDYANAGARAKDLKLVRDEKNSANQGWDAPEGTPNMHKYADQQGPDDGPRVKDMFDGGKLDEKYQRFHREKGGFSDNDGKDDRHEDGKKGDKYIIADALQKRSDALHDVIIAATYLEDTAKGQAKSKLGEIAQQDLEIDKVKLSGDEKVKQKQIGDLTAERDRINAQINAATGVIDGVLAVMAAETLGLKGETAFKAGAGTATALLNIHYDSHIAKIQSAVANIEVKMKDVELKQALLKKQQMINDYTSWLKTALTEKTGDVSKKYGVYKKAHEDACLCFRTAAENKAKADIKERDAAAPPADPDNPAKPKTAAELAEKAKADEAEVKKAGREAEALMHALPVIETVVTAAERGAAATPSVPGYTKESGIGFGLIGHPGMLTTVVAEIMSTRKAFSSALTKWTQRRDEVQAIISSYAR